MATDKVLLKQVVVDRASAAIGNLADYLPEPATHERFDVEAVAKLMAKVLGDEYRTYKRILRMGRNYERLIDELS